MLSFTDFMKVFSAYEQYVQTQPQPMPTVPTPAPQPISMSEYVQRLNAFEQRLSAQENRPPMPTIDTPKPATVDDIILGIVGNAGKENSNDK